MTETELIRNQLKSMAEPEYQKFIARLIPTVEAETILGVRTPNLRKLARSLRKSEKATAFLQDLPHRYFEENQLHAFLIEGLGDYDVCAAELERFLPYVNNWATCDQMAPRILTKDLSRTETKAFRWMNSDRPYTVRYGVGVFLRWYLDESFRPEQAQRIAGLNTEHYYVHMMVAWYFATALAKQYDAVLPYFLQPVLDEKTHNKALQKALESNRISPERKAYLRTLKRHIEKKSEIC